MCSTETWLNKNISNSLVKIDGFNLVRADREPDTSGKGRGSALCLYINSKWCTRLHKPVSDWLETLPHRISGLNM